MRRVFGAVVGAAAVIVLLAGCGSSVVSASAAETTLAKAFKSHTGDTAAHVSCPSNVDAKVGKSFTCHFTSDGTAYVGDMTIQKIQGSTVYFKYAIYR
jgi:Domain of unknown function (DUF4333)